MVSARATFSITPYYGWLERVVRWRQQQGRFWVRGVTLFVPLHHQIGHRSVFGEVTAGCGDDSYTCGCAGRANGDNDFRALGNRASATARGAAHRRVHEAAAAAAHVALLTRSPARHKARVVS